MSTNNPILVTGTAGFIGFHVAQRLLRDDQSVVGLDNLNDYYDPALKQARRAELTKFDRFEFVKLDLSDREGMAALFAKHRFPHVIHLAAQAGVRHSLVDPYAYVDSNLTGFTNILEGCRHCSSGIWSTHRRVRCMARTPIAVFGARQYRPSALAVCRDQKSQRADGAYVSHRFISCRPPACGSLPCMARGGGRIWRCSSSPRLFWRASRSMCSITAMRRDFTYIDDIVEAIVRLVDHVPSPNPSWSAEHPDPASSNASWRVYNIGNNNPVEVEEVVRLLEEAIGKKAKREFLPMQAGDVPATYADVDDLMREVDFKPATPIDEGIQRFVEWYRAYHGSMPA